MTKEAVHKFRLINLFIKNFQTIFSSYSFRNLLKKGLDNLGKKVSIWALQVSSVLRFSKLLNSLERKVIS